MKKLLILVMLVFFVAFCGAAQAKEEAKVLIAYFSYTGNTRLVALQIQKQIGGDLFEITTAKPYPRKYKDCVDIAKKEQNDKARPPLGAELKDKVKKDIADYDVIFIGYPIWWGTLPQVLFTFLDKYDLKGKTIVPFCTHNGGRWARSLDDLKKTCPNSKFRDGITINGDSVRQSKNDVTKWLQKLEITNKK
ncbi:MAG: NAD(P)H-dependent oxidoreductase [Planctomycetaceae bacterium]|jgi:flavodoxin|nr:NAD(P)H-dependent oxidoreductase [Planctomycetaceae bacterium]